MRWFGPKWDGLVCEHSERAPTPEGYICFKCRATIKMGDQGFLVLAQDDKGWIEVPWHKECMLENLGIGGEVQKASS